jgi:taurine transport system substrate-binding protein
MNSWNRRKFIKTSALTGAAIGLAASPLAVFAQSKEINYGGSAWLGHYPVYYALENGNFSESDLKVGWEFFGTSSGRMTALMSGDIDVAGTGVVSAITLMAQGVNRFYVIGVPDNFGRVEGLFAVEGIESITDLKGKTIGTTFASSAHTLVLDLMAQNGLTERDIDVINIPAPEIPAAIQAGQIDACATWTPYFNTVANLPGVKLIADDTDFSLFKDYGVTPGPDVLVVSKRFADRNPEIVKDFVKVYFGATESLGKEPEKAVSVLTELTQMSAEDQLQTIKDADWYSLEQQQEMIGTDTRFVEGLQKLADMLVEYGQIDRSPQVKDWINSDFIR